MASHRERRPPERFLTLILESTPLVHFLQIRAPLQLVYRVPARAGWDDIHIDGCDLYFAGAISYRKRSPQTVPGTWRQRAHLSDTNFRAACLRRGPRAGR